MAAFFRYVIWFSLAVAAIVLGVILGDYGAWYLSWILGTGMMILIAAMGGVLFETQEDEKTQHESAAASSANPETARR